MLSRIRGNGNLSIHWKWRVDSCVGVGCSDSGVAGDGGFDLWAVVLEQDSPKIRPLSNRAPYTERVGCGKKCVSQPIVGADGSGVGVITDAGSGSLKVVVGECGL